MPRPINSEKDTLQDAIILLANILQVPTPPTRDMAQLRDARIKSVSKRLIRMYERHYAMPPVEGKG